MGKDCKENNYNPQPTKADFSETSSAPLNMI